MRIKGEFRGRVRGDRVRGNRVLRDKVTWVWRVDSSIDLHVIIVGSPGRCRHLLVAVSEGVLHLSDELVVVFFFFLHLGYVGGLDRCAEDFGRVRGRWRLET